MNENTIQNDEVEIDLLELVHALLRKWWMILIGGIVGGVAMFLVTSFLITPMYESSAMLYILNKTTSVTSMADIQIGSALSSDFQVIATSKPVIDSAIQKIEQEQGRKFTRKEITDSLTVSNIDDTRLLKISVEHADPEVACMIANAVADATASQMAEIMKSDPPTLAEKAEVSKLPVSPSLMKNTVLGILIGVLVVCGVLIVLFLMNDHIKTEEDVEKYLGVPTIVTLPYTSAKDRKKEVTIKRKEGTHAKQ